MKKSIQWILKVFVTVAALFVANSSKATHLMGADLTYECLGGNTYRVTLSLYRDCIGIAAPSSANISITSSCSPSSVLVVYPRPGTGQEVTPACSSSVTTCRGGTFTGIQEWVYDGIVTLPTQCANWTFSYNPCCRNAAITNISNPGSSTFYIYATLNNLITPCNNSPTFSNKPVPFLCRGQNYCFNHGVYDADGDSITFQLITPKQTASTNVNYLAPFNASNPLTSNPATTFNSTTGDICMTPTNMEVTVMAVLVQEYRNGTLIGSVERDLQLTVMNCANNLPSLSGINGTNNFSITVCANQPTCFNIFSDDPDAGQNLTVTWDQGIPGATFTTTTAQHPTATFCWTPTSAEIGNSYFFTAMVSDDACPYIGSQVYSYTINVVGVRVDLGPDQSIACSDLTTLTAHASGGTPPYQYLWSNGSTMQQVTVGSGTWTVSATDGMCSATDTIEVDMPYIPLAAFNSGAASCANTPVQFTDASTTPGGIIYNWLWNFGDGAMSLDQNPLHQFPGTGTYNVSLVIENTLGCTDTVIQQITIDPQPTASFTASNGCVNATVQFNNLNGNSASTWTWSFGDGFTTNAISPIHSYSSPGNYTVTLIGTSAGGCSDTATQNIQIFQTPQANAGNDRTTCRGTSVTLTASGGSTYNWTPGGNGQSITVNPLGTTNYIVNVTNPNGCSASDTVTVVVNPVPVINAGADLSVCRGSSVTLTASGGDTYVWNPGNMSGSSITVSPNSSTNYTVVGTNIYGCTSSDAVAVNVNQLPNANAGADVDICRGGTATLSATGGGSYNWILTGGTTSIINVNPIANTNYTVIVTDANGCTDTDVVAVTVHENPEVNLQSFFLCTGAVATLDAGISGASYVWSPSGATTQTITINNAGIYGVTVTDAFGCSASASATVTTGSNLTVNLNDVSFCQGDSAILDPGYPGMSYLWSPGGQTTQTLTVSAPGSYGVTVTDPSGCSGSVSVNAQVNALPSAIFNATSVCQGDATQFTDASSVAGGGITNWNWNFGNGNISAQQNPSYTYNTAGTYGVTLTVTSGNGCSASTTGNVTVNPLPIAAFNVQNICAGASAAFVNQSTVSSGNITGYSWNFGDGSTSTDINPNHTYPTAGTYTVTLDIITAGGCSQSVSRQITVFPIPNAAATANSVCQGGPTDFASSSTIAFGNITSYSWDFGDGNTSTQVNPTHVFSNSGNYSVSVIAESNRGCRDTATITTTVYPAPNADAGSDQNICPGGNVTLNATGGNSYFWSPGNVTSASMTVNPSSSTTYSVTVTDIFGCSATDNITVNILNLPNALASGNTSICEGQSAVLTASGASQLTWSPGGLTGSSITVSPATTTDFIVTATDANGCQNQDTLTVTVNPIPNVAAGPDRTICNGSAVALQASGANTYSWTPGGSSNPTLIFTPGASASYVVTGFSAYGCSSSDTVQVTVNPSPVINLLPSFVCQGFTTTLDAGNPGSNFLWSTGETTQTISVSDSGIYSVSVTSANGCVSNDAATVTIGGNMQALPSAASVCNGQTAILDAGNPGSTYAWSNGATTQTINVTTGGNYLVTITDANGCSATTAHQVTVNNIPAPAFSATTACLGTPIDFTNQSSVAGGQIQTISWDFGNGIASSQNNPSFNYSLPGTYTVTLTVTSTAGCSSSSTTSVTVHPLPVADFSAPTSCLGDATAFNDASSVTSGSIVSWTWDFGDNNQSTANTPVHIFSTAGNFNTMLVIESDRGCRDTIVKNISVNGLPVADFNVSNVCAGNDIALLNNSTSVWGTISSSNWTFGDGTSSTNTQPQQSYANAGTYSVGLTVTTVNGCSASMTAPVTVYPNPVASFTGQDVCAGNPVNLSNNSSGNGGTIYANYWTFENNGNSSSLNPAPIFQGEGTYQISLVTTTMDGCRDTANGTVNVFPVPVASFTTQDGCLNTQTAFIDASNVNTGSITAWNWSLGNNTVSNQQQPTVTYASAGTYNVTLDIVTDRGCTASATGLVNIFPEPMAAFVTGNVCFGSGSNFINLSGVPGGESFTSSWSFSGGTSSTLDNPIVTFQSAGMQQAILTVTSASGCTDQVTQLLMVYNSPNAEFTATNNCENIPTQFNDLSTSQDGSIIAWNWTFGDGGSSTDSDPLHQYSNDGQYNVTLTTTSQFGCVDTFNAPVAVLRQPMPAVNALDACAGTPVQFTATSDANGSIFTWDLGNGTTSMDSSFNHTFSDAGTYPVMLTVTTPEGCIGTASADIEIHPLPQPDFSSDAVCLNSITTFDNLTSIANGSITATSWFFGDGQSSASVNPTHTFQFPGNYQTSITATSDRGCTATTTRQVTVFDNPTVSFSTGVQGCRPLLSTPTDMSVVTDGTVTGWLWDFGDGNVSTEQNPTNIYNESGSFTVSLTVVSSNGCQSSHTSNGYVTVFPDPMADFDMSATSIDDMNPTVSFTNLSQGYSAFQWNFGDGTLNNRDLNPVHTFGDTGTFSAMLVTVNHFGCRDTAYRSIDVRPKSTLFAPNCFTPNGDGKNDVFKPEFTNMANIQVWIFDRWGLLLKSWDSLEGNWDGYFNGKKCATDTYVYKIQGLGVEGKPYEWVGHVSIIY